MLAAPGTSPCQSSAQDPAPGSGSPGVGRAVSNGPADKFVASGPGTGFWLDASACLLACAAASSRSERLADHRPTSGCDDDVLRD